MKARSLPFILAVFALGCANGPDIFDPGSGAGVAAAPASVTIVGQVVIRHDDPATVQLATDDGELVLLVGSMADILLHLEGARVAVTGTAAAGDAGFLVRDFELADEQA